MIPDPADYFIRGESEMHRAPDAAGLAGAGLSLEGGAVNIAGTNSAPMAFTSALGTQAWLSTIPYVFGSWTAAAGSAIVIPATGLYTLSAGCQSGTSAIDAEFHSTLIIYVNATLAYLAVAHSLNSATDGTVQSPLPISERIRSLTAGDKVWCLAESQTASATMEFTLGTLFVKYWGPT